MPIFPPSGGASTWLGDARVYVASDGNNGSNGTGWQTAKRNIYNGIERLNELGGGTLYVSNGCAVGGPVSGQGIWLRSDNLPQSGYYFDAPGFLPFSNSRIVGMGKDSLNFGPITSAFTGGGLELFKPAIHIVGSGIMNRLQIFNLQKPALRVGAMIGVDWDRNLDGTVKQIAVSNATRTGTTTVYTVTLPTALTVTRASRTSNVTTLTIPNPSPGLPWPPWRVNVPISFTSGDGSFASGNYVLTDNSNNLNNNTTWTVSYAETGADVPEKAITGSSLKTHGCCAGELIDLTSTDSHFFSTQYMVNSVTATTITVTDVFGDGNRNVNNIGTLAHQERFYGGTTGVEINVNFSLESFLNSKHSLDIGHNAAIAPLVSGGWYEGYVGDGSGPRDERTMSAVYVYAGTTTYGPPNASLTMRDAFTDNGAIYAETGATTPGNIDVRRITAETNQPSLQLPVVRVSGGAYTTVHTEDLNNADSDPTVPTVVLEAVPAAAASCYRSGIVSGSCVGGNRTDAPGIWTSAGANAVTPWERKQFTPWADMRITGKHPAAVRAMGAVAARFKNIIVAPGSWTLRGNTVSTGQLAPDGTSTAVKVTSDASYLSIFPSNTDGNTWQVGGHIQVCGWVNCTGSSDLVADELFRVITTGVTFVESATGSMEAPYLGTGWQFVSCFLTVATVSDSTPDIEIEVRMQNAAQVYLWGLNAFYVPTSVDDNDAYELMGTIRHQPRYLRAGETGTMEGQVFYAHGGLGSVNAAVTLGSANGKSIAAYDAATGALMGYIELKDAV